MAPSHVMCLSLSVSEFSDDLLKPKSRGFLALGMISDPDGGGGVCCPLYGHHVQGTLVFSFVLSHGLLLTDECRWTGASQRAPRWGRRRNGHETRRPSWENCGKSREPAERGSRWWERRHHRRPELLSRTVRAKSDPLGRRWRAAVLRPGWGVEGRTAEGRLPLTC